MIGEIPEQFCLKIMMSLPFLFLGLTTVHTDYFRAWLLGTALSWNTEDLIVDFKINKLKYQHITIL